MIACILTTVPMGLKDAQSVVLLVLMNAGTEAMVLPKQLKELG